MPVQLLAIYRNVYSKNGLSFPLLCTYLRYVLIESPLQLLYKLLVVFVKNIV